MSRKRRSGTGRRRGIATVAMLFVVLGAVVVPAGSFSTGSVTRSSNLEVVADHDGLHRLDIADSVAVGETNRLVNVTNNLGTDVTVEVRLRSDSADAGDLVVGGATTGDSVSVELGAGETHTVAIDVNSDQSLVDTQIYFHVNASGSDLTVTAPNRHTMITQ